MIQFLIWKHYRLVCDKIYHLVAETSISAFQFGFIENRSTLKQVLLHTTKLMMNINRSIQFIYMLISVKLLILSHIYVARSLQSSLNLVSLAAHKNLSHHTLLIVISVLRLMGSFLQGSSLSLLEYHREAFWDHFSLSSTLMTRPPLCHSVNLTCMLMIQNVTNVSKCSKRVFFSIRLTSLYYKLTT